MTITFFVAGKPIPQGSMRAFVAKGRPIITSTSKNLRTWRDLIAMVAQEHRPEKLMEGAIAVELHFILQRPKSAPKRKIIKPTKRPDLDKLVRACLDALTAVIFRDDNQVVELHATKSYDYRSPPGVQISVDAYENKETGQTSLPEKND
jgi:crossover junction endodeoxyribonuclease RusA